MLKHPDFSVLSRRLFILRQIKTVLYSVDKLPFAEKALDKNPIMRR